jgi:hypothetical protein
MSVFQNMDTQEDSAQDSAVASNQRTPKTFQWYQDLRRKMGSKYYSPRVQQQMLKDAQSLGNGFYDTKKEEWE